jgi:hypothetical protein
MRVYLAATSDRLRSLADDRRADGEWQGFAAVDSVRATLGGLGDEELEYALTVAAGEASAALGSDAASPGRRIVIVADVDDTAVTVDPEAPGAVLVRGSIELAHVDAVLADEGPYSVGAGDGDDLGWYGAQEIANLLA